MTRSDDSAVRDDASSLRQFIGTRRLVVLFAIVVAVHALSPSVQVTDSRMSVPTAYAVLANHTLALDHVPSVPRALQYTTADTVHHDHRLLPFFPWPAMMTALPGVAVARAVGIDVGALRPTGSNQTYVIEQPTAAIIVGITFVLMLAIAFELLQQLGLVGSELDRKRRAWWVISAGLVFAFATSAWSNASRALWSATPTMLCSALALFAAIRAKRSVSYLWLLGAALAAAFTMRPTAAVVVIVLGTWALYEFRVAAFRVVVAGAAVLVPFALVNVHYYGSVLPPYWGGSRLTTADALPFWNAFFAQLVSPSRGLLIYSSLFVVVPVVVAFRLRAHRIGSLDVAAAAIVVLHAIVLGKFGSTGGSSYGNRFFTEVLPYLMFLWIPLWYRLFEPGLRSRAARVAVVGTVALSFVTTAPGALARSAFCWSATPKFIDQAPSRMWDVTDPQFLRPIKDLADGHSLRDVVVGSCPGPPVPPAAR